MRVLALSFFCICASAAHAAGIVVMTGGAVLEGEKALAADFTKMTGTGVAFVSGTTGQIQDRLKAGETADLVVIATPALTALGKAGAVNAKSLTDIGRVGIGVGIRDNASALDISTPDAFKQTLLAAKSITYMDPAIGASSGIATAKILKDLGIAEIMAGKTVLAQSGYSAEHVANGEAELAIQNMSEIVPVKGVRLAGPLPLSLQVYTSYSGAVAAKAASPAEAQAFLAYLIRVEAAHVWTQAGVQPAPH